MGPLRPRPARAVLLLVVLSASLTPTPWVLAAPGDITLASTSDAGLKGDGHALISSLSADGSKVAFHSSARNLDPGDTDVVRDVYVKDLTTGDITLASTSGAGVKGNGDSLFPSLSADGAKVSFESRATNLDPSDPDTVPDVYVKDLTTGDITLASTSDAGVKGNATSGDSNFGHASSLSPDGTKVAFGSNATNLDPGDTDAFPDVYVKDLTTGDLTLASTSDAGVKGNNGSTDPSISADGTKVAFDSNASNFPGDTDTGLDVYIKDLTTGDLTLASTSDAGVKGNGIDGDPSISADGTKVAFDSVSTNLDPGDTDQVAEVYMKDLTTGDLTLASTSGAGVKGNNGSGAPSISADGTTVSFESLATNLDPADTDELVFDIYIKDLTTGDLTLASTSGAGVKGNNGSRAPAISADGTEVAFESGATNLDPADSNDGVTDVYVKELGGAPVPSADLSIIKSDSPDPVTVGSPLTYTLAMSNAGPDEAADVTVTDDLPASVTFGSASSSQGNCSQSAGTVTCMIGAVASGTGATVTIEVTPNSQGMITNTASVSSATADPDNADNSDSEDTTVNPTAGVVTFSPHTPYPTGLATSQVVAADFDGDDDLDLAAANVEDFNISILLGAGDGSFAAAVNEQAGGKPVDLAAADVDGNGTQDLLATLREPVGSRGLALLLGDGTGDFAAPVILAAGPRPHSVTVGDLNGDGDVDAVVSHCCGAPHDGNNFVSVILGGPGATFDAPVHYGTGTGIAYDVAIADVNDDAIPDLVTADNPSNLISVLLGNGDGTFGAATTFPAGSGAYSAVVGDFDRDGAQDVAVANETGDSVSVLPGNGTGDFGSPTPYPIGDRPLSIAGGDIDGDGFVDLVVSAFEADEIWVLLAQNDGTFGETSAHPVGDGPSGLTLAELNDDGRLDIAVANQGAGSVSVLLNETPVPFADLSLTKSDSPDPVTLGSPLTYTLAISNAGPDEATDVTMTDNLPASVTFGSASASQGSCSESAGTVTCMLGTMTNGADATVTIEVIPNVEGIITDSASVTSDTADPDNANNSDSENTTVNPAAGGGCTITGTEGNDVLIGTSGDDVICGLGGNDRITGLGGNDTLDGGDGNDMLDGGQGDDILLGGGGRDTLLPGTGANSGDGGLGTDTVSYATAPSAVTVDLAAGTTTGSSTDSLTALENATGGTSADTLVGNGGRNTLNGGNGDDTLLGGGGNDNLLPGTGTNSVDGGLGTDTVSYVTAPAAVSVDLAAGTTTGSSTDSLTAVENATGSRSADTVVGNDGANRLSGGAGHDDLFGGSGNDILAGGAGDDHLDGELGTDRCAGGPGINTIVNCEA